ncbi:MAG: hypothetical protein J6I45_01260 [Clostridia bacterium]|nr:hypothetical protein [Clostridia bacterium]
MAHTTPIKKSRPTLRYVLVMLLLCLLPTLLRSGILQPITVYIEGDVLLESEYAALSGVSDFISCVALFTALGCLITAVFERKKKCITATLIIFALCEVTAALLAAFWQYQLQTNPTLTAGYFTAYAFSGIFVDAAITVGVILLTRLLRDHAEKKGSLDIAPRGAVFRRDNPANLAGIAATLLVFVTTVIRELTVTLPLLLEYGAPINRTELIYLLEPYMMAVIYLLAGYAITALVLMVLVKDETK